MPILGNLSEFPLPEILLLIGQRSGRLRLLDVPGLDCGLVDVDLGQGEIYTLHLGAKTVHDADTVTTTLSNVVAAGSGMFEFTILSIPHVVRNPPIFINQLVLALVFKVDEDNAEKKSHDSAEDVYVLEQPDPEMWIEPDLAVFFMRAKELLQHGARWHELAERLDMDVEQVRANLVNLRLLGVVNLMDELERDNYDNHTKSLQAAAAAEEENHSASTGISPPITPTAPASNYGEPFNRNARRLFPQVAQAAAELQRLTGQMPKYIPSDKK